MKIDNDDSLEEFINNAYEAELETYSNSFGSIIINAKNVKTNTFIFLGGLIRKWYWPQLKKQNPAPLLELKIMVQTLVLENMLTS